MILMDILTCFGSTKVFNMVTRHRWWIFRTACVMFFLSVLMVGIFQSTEVSTRNRLQMARASRMQRESVYFWKDDREKSAEPTTATARDRVWAWDVTRVNCSANYNMSSTEWFKSLQPNFKQFLLYRHCRDFPMIINHPQKCWGDVYLLMVVKSIITQHDRREVIRQTWGKEQEVNGKKIKLLFLLGTSSNEAERANHQKLLEYEDLIYGDILQWDFVDSFFNLTLKETHFLKWFSMYCANVSYVYKGDDDVFVSVQNILEYLNSSKDVRDMFAGDVMFKAKPIRRKENKYYIPPVLYNETYYPPYAGGGGFLMDAPLARKLYYASQTLDMYPIDDVFLGMCLQVLNVTPIKHNAFKTFGLVKNKTSRLNKEPCFYKSMIVVHKLLPDELRRMWTLVNTDLVCTHKMEPLTSVMEKKT